MFNFDPNDPRQAGLMSMALSLLGSRGGNFGQALGQGGQQGLMAYQGAQQNKMRSAEEEQQRKMRELQMGQMQRQADEQTQMRGLAERSFGPNPNLVAGDDQGNPMPQAPGGGGMPEFARGLMGIDPMKGYALQQQIAQANKPDYATLAPGATLYDRAAQKPVYQAPEKTPDWKDPQYEAVQSRIRAAGRPQVTTNVMPPREVFKDSMSLKKDFDAQPEVKGFKEVQSAWDQISGALADPSAANDLAAATKFMKMLDPGSVVRESELAMAMQASGALDRFMNYGNRLKTGQKLTPTQRIEFREAGEALYNASKQRFGETVGQYEGIAKQYGLDAQFLPKPKAVAEKKTITMGGKKVEARQAPDGKFYVKSGNKYYEVRD